MTEGISVPLERFVLDKIAAAERLFCVKLDRLRTELIGKMESDGRALDLAAKEYERRLGILNNAHELAAAVLHTYSPREVVDREDRALSDRIKTLELAHADRLGVSRVVAVVIALTTSLVTAIFMMLVNRIWGH